MTKEFISKIILVKKFIEIEATKKKQRYFISNGREISDKELIKHLAKTFRTHEYKIRRKINLNNLSRIDNK